MKYLPFANTIGTIKVVRTQLIALAVLLSTGVTFAQEQYSRVTIYANNAQMSEITALGIPTDHGKHKNDYSFTTDLSATDIQKLEEHGYDFDILVEDVKEHFQLIKDAPLLKKGKGSECGGGGAINAFDPVTPTNFNLGSMAGYFTYQEMLDNLDSMRSKYPDLISSKSPIGSFVTHEGRPIHWVRLSDNPDSDESEEEVLYSAIHHAREPMSLSQTIFYMWWLLENYGTDEEVTYLVDNTEMYFVPMLNPDGYIHNEDNDPGGGGMHRKNKNPAVGSFNPGVDLNRNYPYHWDESGTSDDENDDTYAGSGPFSEPETQAMEWFCQNRDFKYAFNAHSHGDLILFPIGWSYSEFADDHDYFVRYGNHMTVYNNYINQKATALYPAAGDSDDYMYIDYPGKPKIFAMTPEVGDAFWPSSSAIVPTCKEMIWSNKTLAHMPHIYGVLYDTEPNQIEDMSGVFDYDMERLGLTDGDITVSATALEGIETIGGPNVHALTMGEIESGTVTYTLESGIVFGDPIVYVLHTDNGSWIRHDTISKSFGAFTAVFTDDGSDIDNWTADGDWGYTNEEYVSPSNSITDSPYDGTYKNNENSDIVLNQIFDFSEATYAAVRFYAQWDIEDNYDYVQFMVSTNEGSSWTPLCGLYTNEGSDDQDEGEPLYDGVQNSWVLEEVDLTDYIGESDVRFRFRFVSDIWVNADGFYFDDFTVYSDAGTSGIEEQLVDSDIHIYPNPTSSHLNVQLKNLEAVERLDVFNDLGQLVGSYEPDSDIMELSTSQWNGGIYSLKTTAKDGSVLTKRFTVLR